MSDLFTAPAVPTLPVEGTSDRVAVRRVFCVGRNYEEHAKEMGVAVDRQAPFYFLKGAYATVESGATIPYPPGTSNFHHEMELVAVIGRGGFRIAAGDALDHVYGYACGLDMTRRDLQLAAREKGRPWDLGKDFERSAVVGLIRRASEIGHPTAGRIELQVNGELRQGADLAELVWSLPELIADLSRYYHLQPGDLLFTGTPAGVGPVVAGDRITGRIDGVGTIELAIGPAE